jgi:hypothetical protein
MSATTRSTPSSFSTHEKAQQINLDPTFYGTFAEIGAGQEVARWFFRVGGAAGTVAKSMSAYDMTFSDAIYGPAQRYVSRERLLEMLDHEYRLLQERLSVKRGNNTRFFVFANTVVAKGYHSPKSCHAWTGMRMQTRPGGPINQLLLHYRLLDKDHLQQQEAIGIMGVNLLYAAYMFWDDLDRLLPSLIENLGEGRIEVDYFHCTGEDLRHHDNRLAALKMVQSGVAKAALVSPEGEVLQPSDAFYKRSLLLERGVFRPITKVNLDLLERARARFLQEEGVEQARPMEILEMTTRNLMGHGALETKDFLERMECIQLMRKHVLISSQGEFYLLQEYLERYTENLIGIVIGQPLLKEIFNEKYYQNLPGGILEGFGRLFKNALKVYVYPSFDPARSIPLRSDDLELSDPLKHLYHYLRSRDLLEDLPAPNTPLPYQPPSRIAASIRSGNPEWEAWVPAEVARLIREKNYFDYPKSL